MMMMTMMVFMITITFQLDLGTCSEIVKYVPTSPPSAKTVTRQTPNAYLPYCQRPASSPANRPELHRCCVSCSPSLAALLAATGRAARRRWPAGLPRLTRRITRSNRRGNAL